MRSTGGYLRPRSFCYCHRRGPLAYFQKGTVSRYCHDSPGKMLENGEQKMNMEEKLALSLHRNFLILLENSRSGKSLLTYSKGS
jgi:hypothetical protein